MKQFKHNICDLPKIKIYTTRQNITMFVVSVPKVCCANKQIIILKSNSTLLKLLLFIY